MYWELQAQANQPLSGVPSTVTADGFWQPDIEMLVNMPLASAFFVAPDPPRFPPLTAAQHERSERNSLAAHFIVQHAAT